jgi:hypothetical protein
MRSRHTLHIAYHDADKNGLLLDGIRPALARLGADGTNAFLLRHWWRGPHLRLNVRTDERAWRERVRPLVEKAVGAYLAAHPSVTVLDPAASLDRREPPVARSTREDPRPLSDRRAADLAAGHIAEACTARSPVRVFGLTGGGPHAGTVRWRGIPRGRDDAALLARTGRRATAMGTGVHEPPRHPLPDVGLPQLGRQRRRPPRVLAGDRHPEPRQRLRRRQVRPRPAHQPPQPRDGTASPWAGLSGAAIPRATPRRDQPLRRMKLPHRS